MKALKWLWELVATSVVWILKYGERCEAKQWKFYQEANREYKRRRIAKMIADERDMFN